VADRRAAVEEARTAAAVAARRKAEEEAKKRAAAEAGRRRTSPTTAASADDDEIVFAPVSADEMVVEIAPSGKMDLGDEEAAPSARSPTIDLLDEEPPARSSSRAVTSPSLPDDPELLEEAAAEEREEIIVDLDVEKDEDRKPTRTSASAAPARSATSSTGRTSSSSASSSSKASSAKPSSSRTAVPVDLDEDSRRDGAESRWATPSGREPVGLSARFGTSGYQTLQFLTMGGEITIPVGRRFRIEVGADAFTVKRTFPADMCSVHPDQQGEILGCTRWNTILPIEIGGRYVLARRALRPYVGADMLVTPYTDTFDVALGGRARGGLDWLFSSHVGLNLDANAGILWGSQFYEVEEGLVNTGLLWQATFATVFML